MWPWTTGFTLEQKEKWYKMLELRLQLIPIRIALWLNKSSEEQKYKSLLKKLKRDLYANEKE